MTPEPKAAFLLAILAMELTPGPNMAYLGLVAARSGRSAGLKAVAGVTCGLMIYLLATIVGLAEAAVAWPWIFQPLRWAGVAYLLWLAFDAWRQDGVRVIAEPIPTQRLFLRGLLTSLLNPKTALLYVTMLPAFIDPAHGPALQALRLGALHIAISIVVHSALVMLADGAHRRLVPGDIRLGAPMAVALVAVAIWMAASTG